MQTINSFRFPFPATSFTFKLSAAKMLAKINTKRIKVQMRPQNKPCTLQMNKRPVPLLKRFSLYLKQFFPFQWRISTQRSMFSLKNATRYVPNTVSLYHKCIHDCKIEQKRMKLTYRIYFTYTYYTSVLQPHVLQYKCTVDSCILSK